MAAPGVSAPLWRACDNEHVSLDHVTVHVDLRIRTASFSAEAALTADLVPVDVDAILFWMVWASKKACSEVENYPKAVLRSAQTAMRDVIGQLNLADVSMRRKQIDHELEEALDEKCEQRGITVMSVEIRDIMIPPELQNALSKEAQRPGQRLRRAPLAAPEGPRSERFPYGRETMARCSPFCRSLSQYLHPRHDARRAVAVAPALWHDGRCAPPRRGARRGCKEAIAWERVRRGFGGCAASRRA